MPPWHVLLGAVLLIVSLFHYLSGPTGADWLENFNYIALGSVALCLPLIALRAALALRRGVSAALRCAVRAVPPICLLFAVLGLKDGCCSCAQMADASVCPAYSPLAAAQPPLFLSQYLDIHPLVTSQPKVIL